MKAVRAVPGALCAALIGCLSTASAQSSMAEKIPFERLAVSLTLRVRENEFIVARTDDDLRKMWELHARPPVPGTTSALLPSEPPTVDFRKVIIIAFFGGHSTCEPYRIADVLEFPDRVTVEVSHRVQGDTCICELIFAPSIDVVSIQRTDKPVDYVINSERIDCGP